MRYWGRKGIAEQLWGGGRDDVGSQRGGGVGDGGSGEGE